MQQESLLHHQLLLQENNQRKVNKWQVCAWMKPLIYKGCSSKSFFQGLHTQRVQKLDGTWTETLFELDHECHDHFQKLFAALSAPTQ